MEVVAQCGTDLKRSWWPRVESGECAMAHAHSWSDEEIIRLSDLIWLKKTAELKNLKKASESKQKEVLPVDDDEEKVFAFRRRWIKQWSGQCNSLESITKIRAMPFTYHSAPPHIAYPCDTPQIISVQVAGLFGGLELPLDVFGMVAVRDSVDHNRNLVFFHSRIHIWH